MFEAPDTPYLVPFDGSFRVADADAERPDDAPDKKTRKARLADANEELDTLQRVLYAENRWSLLVVFQALDAAGKDGTIRAVFEGVNPAGCQVHSFKQPSAQELDHDFLWRTAVRLPERGRIGVFNRSYYEEVLVVRVHPEYLEGQQLPGLSGNGSDDVGSEASKPSAAPLRSANDLPTEFWQHRFESIRDHELHLARNGTAILKFWLNVSKDEQRERFLSRLNEPEKHWKFSVGDVREREHWDAYMHAYESALAATSRSWAPWYAIPADSKSYMRMVVSETIVAALQSLGLAYPTVDDEARARFEEMRAVLEEDGPGRA
jgi:PPK2 family polyphosphate:nucleotide phosphotransferase